MADHAAGLRLVSYSSLLTNDLLTIDRLKETKSFAFTS